MDILGKLKKNGAARAPSVATDAVLKPSDPVAPGMREVDGIDFDDYAGRDLTVAELVAGMTNMGFQASAVTEATRIINDMVKKLLYFVSSEMGLKKRNSGPGVIRRRARRRPSS